MGRINIFTSLILISFSSCAFAGLNVSQCEDDPSTCDLKLKTICQADADSNCHIDSKCSAGSSTTDPYPGCTAFSVSNVSLAAYLTVKNGGTTEGGVYADTGGGYGIFIVPTAGSDISVTAKGYDQLHIGSVPTTETSSSSLVCYLTCGLSNNKIVPMKTGCGWATSSETISKITGDDASDGGQCIASDVLSAFTLGLSLVGGGSD